MKSVTEKSGKKCREAFNSSCGTQSLEMTDNQRERGKKKTTPKSHRLEDEQHSKKYF